MKKYNNTIQRGEITHYFKDRKLYFIVYESGDNKKISHKLLNQYSIDTDRDRLRQITRVTTRLQRANIAKESKNKPSPAGSKLPAHFAMAVYDEEIEKLIEYKQLINQSNKQTREWWQKLSANEPVGTAATTTKGKRKEEKETAQKQRSDFTKATTTTDPNKNNNNSNLLKEAYQAGYYGDYSTKEKGIAGDTKIQ